MFPKSGSTRNNLQRAKSTTSVKDRRKHPLQTEPIDPHTARTHALIAAHRAVDRSRASASTELERSDSTASRRTGIGSRDHNASFSPATHLRRQRSTLQTRVPKLAESLQVPKTHINRGGTYEQFDYIAEFGLQGESYGAEPSSYRRLRRSKSLITPARQIHRTSSRTPETSLSQAPTLRTAASSIASQSPGLKVKLKRSLNFIRQSPATGDRVFTAPPQISAASSCNSKAVSLARNQYYQDLDGKELCKKSSLTSIPRTNRIEKTSPGNFHTNDPVHSSMPPPVENPNRTVRSMSQRSSSMSLGNKIRKLFTKSKLGDTLPPQHLEASRPHFNIDMATPSPEAGFDSYLNTEPKLAARKSLYVPSSFEEDKCKTPSQLSQRLDLSGSCDSLSSKSKSRVTSWSNSTTSAGSVSVRPSGYEPKRLSVIKEDGGPHQPSCSAGRHIGGVTLFQQPLNFPQGQKINSQRIYSALIKRIDEEQKEMEKTRNALQEIHEAQDQDQVLGHYLFSAPTIRRVESRESVSQERIKENSPSIFTKGLSRIEPLKPSNTGQSFPVSERRMKEIEHESIQSNVFSSSYESKTHNSSPLRNSYVHKRLEVDSQDPSVRDCELDENGWRADIMDLPFSSKRRFGQSTDSVYSRTTNGGTNLDYASPIESTENFGCQPDRNVGMDNVFALTHTKADSLERPSSSAGSRWNGVTPKKGAWKLWMDHQLKDIDQKRTTSKSSHIREHAQIDPDDTGIGGNDYRFPKNQAGFNSTMQVKFHNSQVLPGSVVEPQHPEVSSRTEELKLSTVRLKQVPRNFTPMPQEDSILRRSQSALLSQTNKVQSPTTDSRRSHGARRISPKSVANILKSRESQSFLLNQMDLRKENTPVDKNDSPPVSTPGRYRPQWQSENSTGRARGGKNAVGLVGNGDDHWTESEHHSQDHSPSGGLKNVLSARLSKPFDMDIPDRNRPFDSTYLGKREAGNGNRLSVAPNGNVLRRPKTYGDLRQPPYSSNKTLNDTSQKATDYTASPAHNSVGGAFRSVSSSSFGSVSKRMISSFWKGRRKQENDQATQSVSQSPAFI